MKVSRVLAQGGGARKASQFGGSKYVECLPMTNTGIARCNNDSSEVGVLYAIFSQGFQCGAIESYVNTAGGSEGARAEGGI